eukprot:TRINITY_DN18206_c0_g1_i1.p1 TRINITY_DN18206_c0_g1~~TRINITY_DN18206_c0_g1_i1.p1  ORF type:complete len:309 (+),score=55.27 TRINITY_DN18206_c0_g1_i1:53-979(+)
MSIAIVKKKPSSQSVKRFLENREPKLIENTKTCLFIRGEKTSQIITQVLKDLCTLKKPQAIFYNKKNKVRPFEDPSSLEFFSRKADAGLFVFGTHSKKRPHNLVLGRLFDHQILDMIELGITNFTPIDNKQKLPGFGSKPAFIFVGSEFTNDETVKKLGNLMLDIFRGHQLEFLNLAGIDHVIILTSFQGTVYFRHYHISLKKSGTNLPRVELEDIGPSFDMTIRRTKLAASDLLSQSLQKPKGLKPKKVKNIQKTSAVTTGRVFVPSQDMSKVVLHKMKGTKRKRVEEKEANKKAKGHVGEIENGDE